jgi:hypothetical protein
MSFYTKGKFVGTNQEFQAFLQGRESIRGFIADKLHEAPLDADGYAIVNVQALLKLLGEDYEETKHNPEQ